MKKEKLSILIYSLASGGAEKVISILANNLTHKYDITLVLMRDKIDFDIPKNINIVFLEKSNPKESGILKLIKLPYLGWKYKKILIKYKSNISLSFMNRANYINIIAKLYGAYSKTIISERAMPSLQHKHGIQGKINRILIKHLYIYADTIIANSKGNRNDLKKHFNIKKCITIANPVDIEKIEQSAMQKIDIEYSDKFKFITIGRLDKGKNHQLIIEAMINIDAILYIIGEGELHLSLTNQIKQLKLEHKVFLLGKQTNPYKYLSKADCFVFSSNYEGFPNVILEALSCGIPIISTDCESGPREILSISQNEKTTKITDIEVVKYGILTPTNNKTSFIKAMLLIKQDDILRENFRSIAKQRAKSFDKKIILKQFIDILSSN